MIYPMQMSQSRALSWYGSISKKLNTGCMPRTLACGWLTVHRTCYIYISNTLLFILAASGLSLHWHTILHVPTIYISISFAEQKHFFGGILFGMGGGGGPRLFHVNLINFNFPRGGGDWIHPRFPSRSMHLYIRY